MKAVGLVLVAAVVLFVACGTNNGEGGGGGTGGGGSGGSGGGGVAGSGGEGGSGGFAGTGGSAGAGGEAGSGGSGGSGGEGGIGGVGGSAGTGGTGGSGGTGGTGGSGGTGGAGGTGGSGGQTSTVTGRVVTRQIVGSRTPVSGATVGVFGTSLSTTSGASGEFTLENVPNGDVFFTTTASEHWGIVDYYEVPSETLAGAELGVVPDEEFALIETELGRTITESDGAVVIAFGGAEGGETGTISAASDDPFTFDPDGNLMEQQEIIADSGGHGELIFTAVNPAEGPITATVTGASGATSCQIDESLGTTYPIFAKSVTIVYAYCQAL